MKWVRIEPGRYAADGPDGAEYIVERRWRDDRWHPRSGGTWAPEHFRTKREACEYTERAIGAQKEAE